MNGSLFVLSGEDLTFPAAEIRALVETYSRTLAKCENLGPRIIHSTLDDPALVDKVSRRAAYCRFGGEFFAEGGSLEELIEELRSDTLTPGKTFVVASETLDRPPCADLGALIQQKTAARVSLEDPDTVFQLEKTQDSFVLGISRSGFKSFSWRQRRPRARRFFLPSAIFPKLACLLVNLSRVEEGEIFLDPFCGTGSLLIESCVMGITSVGFDLTRWIAKGAQMNLNGLSLDQGIVVRADSTSAPLPLSYADGIATDVPYGRASSTKGKATAAIITQFTRAAADLLDYAESRKKPKYCVVMHPLGIDFDYDASLFELAEEHHLYVHRNLTRSISVLKRRKGT